MRVHKIGLVFAALLAASSAAHAACQPDRIHLRSDAGQAAFTIEIADDPEERALGLMHRDSMARFCRDKLSLPCQRVTPVAAW